MFLFLALLFPLIWVRFSLLCVCFVLWAVCLVNNDSCCANLIEGWMNYEVALTCTVVEELLCLFELNILHVFTCAKKSKGGEVVSVI